MHRDDDDCPSYPEAGSPTASAVTVVAPPPVTPPANRSLAGDSTRLFVGQVAGNAGLFVAVLLVARALGPSGRGLVGFVTVCAMVASTISKVGISQATTVFAAQRPASRAALLSNLLVFSVASGLVVGAAVAAALLLVPGLRPAGLDGTLVALLVAGCVARSLCDASFLLGCQDTRRMALFAAAGGWVSAVAVAALAVGPGITVTSATAAWVVSSVVVGVAMHVPPLRALGVAAPQRKLLRDMLQFGVRSWGGNLAAFLNARVDQILMGLIATASALGIYAVAVNVSEPLLYVPTAIALAMLPRAASEAPAGISLRAFRVATVIAVGSAVAAVAVGPWLLPIVFGEAFRSSVGPFLLLVPGVFGYAAMAVFSNALLACGAPGRSSLVSVVALVVGIGLDLALIPPFGAAGAAAAATAAFTVSGASALVLFRRMLWFPWADLVPRMSDVQQLAPAWLRGHATAHPAPMPESTE